MDQEPGGVRMAPSGKRVRVVLGGQVVVDTVDALYVWEHPAYPQYYLPLDDVVPGVLEPSGTTARSPFGGQTRWFTVRAGTAEARDAAWCHGESALGELRTRVRFEWGAMDAWFEEDEEVFVHPRDPSTRVQVLPSSRLVEVEVDGTLVARSGRPVFLFETGLPRRTYLSKLDVRMDLLVATTTTSMCPYKGTARYWSLEGAGGRDLAWSYPAPLRESAPVAGLVAFFDERVDLRLDGRPQPRPPRRPPAPGGAVRPRPARPPRG